MSKRITIGRILLVHGLKRILTILYNATYAYLAILTCCLCSVEESSVKFLSVLGARLSRLCHCS